MGGTRKNQGKVQTSVSASHLSHLVVLSLLAVVALALCLLVLVLRSSPFQCTYGTDHLSE